MIMRKLVMALGLVLTAMCGTAAAETFTGPITTTFKGLGENFREIQVDGKWMVIGCGPDSGLSEALLAYLDDHWDKTGSVMGEAFDDPHLGLCIRDPGLAEQKADNAATPTPSKLAEYGWIKLPQGLTAEEMEIVETSLTGIFWDPVYQVPVNNFVGVCRYFHERGFVVDVGFKLHMFENPEQSGVERMHRVSVTVVNAKEDIALKLTLGVVYTCPPLEKELARRFGDTGAKAYLTLTNTAQTDQYSRDKWRPLTPEDWFVIMKSIIKNGYVEEG